MIQIARESELRRKPGKHSTEPDEVWYCHSDDNGRTWTPAERASVPPIPPDRRTDHHLQIASRALVLKDGTQLKTVGGEHPSSTKGRIWDWGSVHCDQYSMRSTDGGRTWSDPVPLDGPPRVQFGFKSGLKVVKPGESLQAIIRDQDGVNVLNTTAEGRQANRRIEFTLLGA